MSTRSKTNAQEPQLGELIADKYRLEGIIGRGGFGIVYEATRADIGQRMALKVLLPEWIHQDPDLAIRFRREALLASQLRHPNTITLYDHGQRDDGLLYMAMEYVEGNTLSHVLRKESPIAPERLVHIFRQILGSLKEAHELGIVHRDLKPSNIMLTQHRKDREFAKVLDFGVAKAISPGVFGFGGDLAQTLTQAGRFCGTPRYMAPEQFRGGDITPACDLYALGLIGFELLTGRPAIRGQTMVDIIVSQVTEPNLQLPDTLNVPAGLRHTINTALQKQSAERYQRADHFLHDLDFWSSPQRPPAYTPPPDATEQANTAPANDETEATIEMKASMWADVVNKYNVPGGGSAPAKPAPRPSSDTATSSSSTPAIPRPGTANKPQRPPADEFPTFPEKPDIPAGFVLPDPLSSSQGGPALHVAPINDETEATIEVSANPEFLGHLRDDRLRARQRNAVSSPPPALSDTPKHGAAHAGGDASAQPEPGAHGEPKQRPVWLIVAAIVALVVVGVVVAWVATS